MNHMKSYEHCCIELTNYYVLRTHFIITDKCVFLKVKKGIYDFTLPIVIGKTFPIHVSIMSKILES